MATDQAVNGTPSLFDPVNMERYTALAAEIAPGLINWDEREGTPDEPVESPEYTFVGISDEDVLGLLAWFSFLDGCVLGSGHDGPLRGLFGEGSSGHLSKLIDLTFAELQARLVS